MTLVTCLAKFHFGAWWIVDDYSIFLSNLGHRKIKERAFQPRQAIHNIYIYTYIHTYMHAYIHTYIDACIHTYMHACMHTYIHAYIYIYIHEAMIYRPFFCLQPRGFLYYKCGGRGQVSSILLALLLLWCIPWIPSIIIRLPRVVAGQLGHETFDALRVARRRQIWGVKNGG